MPENLSLPGVQRGAPTSLPAGYLLREEPPTSEEYVVLCAEIPG